MSKKLISKYQFGPGAAGIGTVKVPGKVTLEQFILITNSTTNDLIFNFIEDGFGGSVSYNSNDDSTFPNVLNGVTTLTLELTTAGMLSSHRLNIMVDEIDLKIRPYDFGTDAIERIRTADPQSLIDADFEYGLQSTKWLGLSLIRNYPSFFEVPGTDLTITSMSTDGANPSLITVNTVETHALVTGSPITVQAVLRSVSGYSRAEGAFILFDAPGATQMRYYAKGIVGTASQSVLTDNTILRKNGIFTSAGLNVSSISSNSGNPSAITVTTAFNHGLFPGSPISVVISSGGSNHQLAAGAFFVEQVINQTSFKYTARTSGVVAASITGTVYTRPDCFYIHRPFDGGVLVSPGGPAIGAHAIRATKKYFRYQSGKGLFFSTGTLLKPNYDVQSVTATGTSVGSVITITTDGTDHGLQIGATIELLGIFTSGYNGQYTVSGVDTDTSFQVVATSVLGNVAASLDLRPRVYVTLWNGSSIRVGPHDDQNGIFWEFNGSVLNAVIRNSVLQLSGTVAVVPDNNTLTGTNTRFLDQLRVGDEIVLRGMVHTVTSIQGQTSLSMVPDFRGVSSVSGVRVCIVRETRVPSSQFNIDTLDGNGPSGFVINLSRMQMLGIQYSWYGAGFVDFMIRGADGNFLTAHRIKNNNVNDEAYMRSGNLPVRYSVINDGARTSLTSTINSTSTGTITVSDASRYPNTGSIYINNEIISYSAKANNTLSGLTRASSFSTFTGGSNRTFSAGVASSHAANDSVFFTNINCSPTLNHWGSSLIMDGKFDSDRGYLFSAQKLSLTLSTTFQTAFMIRLSPSVSNGLVGDLGIRDLLNRAQILLNALEITAASSAAIIVEGVLNPSNYPVNPVSVTWTSLSPEASSGQPSFTQFATTYTFASGAFARPGETIFSFVAGGTDTKTLDLTSLKELSTTPIGGRGTFPNGPDVLAINVRAVTGTPIVHIVLRWAEAQA